jgi:hypothetical protein
MYHLLKGLHEYLTRYDTLTLFLTHSKCQHSTSQEGRVFRHYHRPRWRGQDSTYAQLAVQPGFLILLASSHRLSSRRSRLYITTCRAYHQTKSSRLWVRTVRIRTPPSARYFFTNRHPVCTSPYSREDSSALSRAPILGPRRPARDPVYLAEILR